MLTNRKLKFYLLLFNSLISNVYFRLTEARCIDVQCNTWLFFN